MLTTTGNVPDAGHEHPGEARDHSRGVVAALSRTRLVGHRSRRRDDDQVLALVHDLPGSASARSHVFTVGLLNEAGEVYREVDLHGEYEAVLFTARMNARGFRRLQPGDPFFVDGYDSLFARR